MLMRYLRGRDETRSPQLNAGAFVGAPGAAAHFNMQSADEWATSARAILNAVSDCHAREGLTGFSS